MVTVENENKINFHPTSPYAGGKAGRVARIKARGGKEED